MKKYENIVGKRIMLLRCNDPYTTIPMGTKGTVRLVDAAGTVHVKWDNGDGLGLCPDDGDEFAIIMDDT